MKTYFVKQKFRLGGERFDIKDDQGRVAYQVEGSFFKIPKTFTIFGEDGREISHITKEPLSLLPKFTVDLRDGSSFYIRHVCVAPPPVPPRLAVVWPRLSRRC